MPRPVLFTLFSLLIGSSALAGDLVHTEVWSASGEGNGGFGSALATGDFNGDGLQDLAASASGCGEGDASPGCVSIYTGTAESFEAAASWQIAGSGDQMTGNRLSAADLNQDGFDDLLVTPGANSSSELYLGSATGLESTPVWSWGGGSTNALPDGVIVGDMDGDELLEIAVTDAVSGTVEIHHGDLDIDLAPYLLTNNSHDNFGVHLAAAGSPDGDIFADLLVLTGTTSTQEAGAAWLFAGSSQGPLSEAIWSYGPEDEELGAAFGWTGAGIGDINGDGIDDFAISAPGTSADGVNGNLVGAVAIWEGQDVGPETEPNTLISHGESDDSYGAVLSGGVDLTDNTFDDLLVGAPDLSASGSSGGAVTIHQGAFAGLESNVAHTVASAEAFTSAVSGFGRSLTAVSDEGPTGKTLVVVGSPDEDLGAVYAYAVSVDEDEGPGPNPNTSEPKDKDSFAESQCGCSVGAGFGFGWLLVMPLLAYRRRP
jgi:hypothetical protein